MKFGILTKLSIAFFIIVFLITGITALSLDQAFQVHFVSTFESTLEANAKIASELIMSQGLAELTSADSGILHDMVSRISEDTNARATITLPDGTVLADSWGNSDWVKNPSENPKNQPSISTHPETIPSSRNYATIGQGQWIQATAPLRSGDRILGMVKLSKPIGEIRQIKVNIQSKVMLAALVSIFLAGGIAYLIALNMARPLREMTDIASKISNGDLSRRVRITSGDEMGRLADALNYMADRLSVTIYQTSEERNKMRAILASMVDGVVAVDSNNRIILMNPAAEEMFGVSEEMALGRKFLEAIRNYGLVEAISNATRGEVRTAEFKVFTPDERTLRVSVTCIEKAGGGEAGVVAVIQDVTELRRLEQVRTEFVSNVSHELRTPLTSIKGFIETLLDGAMEDPDTARRFLQIIQKEANRLERLISDLLDLSRIESGHIELKKRPTNLARLAESVHTVLKRQSDAKGLTVEVTIPEEFPEVMADADLLRQVFMNLIDNSIKYTPSGGKITIGASMGNEAVEVFVEDTGIGIPKAHLSRLFERFYRVDKARSREVGGTGLGLAIVKHIVERHGGKAWIDSEVGKGTRVTFTIPHSSAQRVL